MSKISLENLTHPLNASLSLDECNNFISQFRGLMFRKLLPESEGLYFPGTHDSKVDTSIHMFFMNFDIAVIWLDAKLQVDDVQKAMRWPPLYFPRVAARHFLEIHPARITEFHIGDQLVLEKV